MPSICEDIIKRKIKEEAKSLLEDFHWIIREMAFAIYWMPYSTLPAQTRRALRLAARQVIENRIDELC
jgi:hypothetical protein